MMTIEIVLPFKDRAKAIVHGYKIGCLGFVEAVNMAYKEAMEHHIKAYPNDSNKKRAEDVDAFVQKIFVEDAIMQKTEVRAKQRTAPPSESLPWEQGG